MTTEQANQLKSIYDNIVKNYSVIQLSANYSASVNYRGTATAIFTLPSDKIYIGAGILSMSHSGNQQGGSTGAATITYNNNQITVSVVIGGNWGSTTITGTIILNVFICDK